MKPLEDIQKGEIVQAVVIADSFNSKFGPLTANKPRVRFRDLSGHFLSFLKFFCLGCFSAYCLWVIDQS